jgi:hypothetical protein
MTTDRSCTPGENTRWRLLEGNRHDNACYNFGDQMANVPCGQYDFATGNLERPTLCTGDELWPQAAEYYDIGVDGYQCLFFEGRDCGGAVYYGYEPGCSYLDDRWAKDWRLQSFKCQIHTWRGWWWARGFQEAFGARSVEMLHIWWFVSQLKYSIDLTYHSVVEVDGRRSTAVTTHINIFYNQVHSLSAWKTLWVTTNQRTGYPRLSSNTTKYTIAPKGDLNPDITIPSIIPENNDQNPTTQSRFPSTSLQV